MKKKVKKWLGNQSHCDTCDGDVFKGEYFCDCKTKFGPWGLLCSDCFPKYGLGIGVGVGQKYNSKTKEKIDG